MTFDILLDGLLTGGVYALAALGYVMVFKSSHILNLAYGQMIAISAYVLYWLLTSVGVPTWLGILLLFAFGAALGFLSREACHTTPLGSIVPDATDDDSDVGFPVSGHNRPDMGGGIIQHAVYSHRHVDDR